MMVKAENTLLNRARQGDADALTALLSAHGPAVRRLVGAAIDPRWHRYIDLDDLMQVSYLEAFLSIRRFSSGRVNAFRAWLLRIARNNLRDALRELRQARKPDAEKRVELPGGDESYVGLMEVLTSSTTPSRCIMRREQIAAVKAAIGELPELYRQTVEQVDINLRPVVEVARTLGRSQGAVYMIRARAHERLRESLSRTRASRARGRSARRAPSSQRVAGGEVDSDLV